MLCAVCMFATSPLLFLFTLQTQSTSHLPCAYVHGRLSGGPSPLQCQHQTTWPSLRLGLFGKPSFRLTYKSRERGNVSSDSSSNFWCFRWRPSLFRRFFWTMLGLRTYVRPQRGSLPWAPCWETWFRYLPKILPSDC